MFKTAAALSASLSATAILWGWTSGQFTDFQAKQNQRFANVQAHQGDSLQAVICFLEYRIERSPRVTEKQKIEAVHFYDAALRIGHLARCSAAQLHDK